MDGQQVAAAAPRRFRPAAIPAAVLFLLVTAVHLYTQLNGGQQLLADTTQILLMPLLAWLLLSMGTGAGGRLVRWVLTALAFSWLGDTVPRFLDGQAGFLAMVGGFLLAQGCYIAAFWPYRVGSLLARPLLVLPYLAALAVLVLWCAPGAGNLLIPVLIYGAALAMMAILATGLGVMAGVGGAIFLVSDAMIAVRSFTDIPAGALGFWIMLSYVLGQSLIVAAVWRRSAPAPSDRAPMAGRR